MKKRITGLFEKISDFHDKHEGIIIFFILLIILCSSTFHFKFMPFDYVWDFGNIYKLILGYHIYEEVAIIITPLFFYVGEIFLKIFGANFFVYNILNVIMELVFYMCVFVILKKLIKSIKFRDLILLGLVMATIKVFGSNGPNYIPFSSIFIMLIVISTLYMKNNNWRRVLEGFLAALALLSYQKAGAVAVLIIVLYETFSDETTKKSKEFFNICISGITMVLTLGIYIVYLLITKNLYNFLDIAILGIAEFTGNFGIQNITLVRLIAIEIVALGFLIILIKYKKINDTLRLLYFANISSILYLYPVVNEYHNFIWLTFAFLYLVYAIDVTFDGFEFNSTKQKILMTLIYGFILVYSIVLGIVDCYRYPFYKTQYSDMFFGSTLTQEQADQIKEVNNYIKEKQEQYDKVIVFSSYAMLYENTFINNNRFFDLPNKGNFGAKGEQGLIDEIKKMNNTLILVQNEESEYELYQFPNNVRNYIRENYESVDKLQNYDIYEINNK